MYSFNPTQQTERENYKLMTGTILARPVAFVTTLNDNGIVNGAPYSYFNIVSSNPPRISISVQRNQGQLKDTARNILANGQFVVHITDVENVEMVNTTAVLLPPDESEIELVGFTTVPSDVVKVPGVNEAKVRFECVLDQALTLNDDAGNVATDFIIGKIVMFHLDESILHNSYVQYEKLAPVGRLAGNDYVKLGEIFTLARPTTIEGIRK